MLTQLRFATIPAASLLALASLPMGGFWTWLGAACFLAIAVFADIGAAEYRAETRAPNRRFLEALILAGPPLVALLFLALVLAAAAPGTAGAVAARMLGLPGDPGWVSLGGFVFTSGLLSGATAVTFAHELIHRPGRAAWLAGQFVLARCLHPGVAIEHIHGHHVHVGTPRDRSTAPRGQGFWRFMAISAVFAWRHAALHEAARLRRAGRPVLSRANRFLEAVAMMLAMLAFAWAVGGVEALLAILASGLVAVAVIELTNYVLHYGLVRVPGEPVRPRHSWNAPLFFSTGAMINGQRHSHHHASAATPYWALRMVDGAATYPFNTGLMSVIALVPPLWFRVMQPHLDRWDRAMASPGERAILRGEALRPEGLALARAGG